MKIDNFVLLIISIVTLIVISLLTECNRGRLTELENKATKEIVETFFHLGSADPTELGQWGYQITGITQGKYGGRSRQQVINKLLEVGSHSENDYITETEKDAYGSGLFRLPLQARPDDSNCEFTYITDGDTTADFCQNKVNNRLAYKYGNFVPKQYEGKCDVALVKDDESGRYYQYITDSNFNLSNGFQNNCIDNNIVSQFQGSGPDSKDLLEIVITTNNTVEITEPTWAGFFSSEEVSKILFPSYDSGNKLGNEKTIAYYELQTLKNNQKGLKNSNNT